MKSLVLCFLTAAFAVTNACGQGCERTVTVGMLIPSGSPSTALPPDYYQATLGRRELTITRVEPIVSTRLLILVTPDLPVSLRKNKDFRNQVRLLESIDAIPANVSLAYGVTRDDRIFASAGFTSNAEELRNNLHDLITRVESRTAGPPLKNILDFFQEPRPGDAVIVFFSHLREPPMPAFENFLEKGVRLFAVGWDDGGSTGDCCGIPAEDGVPFTRFAVATGGHGSAIGGRTTLKRYEQGQWEAVRNFWLYGVNNAYAVTIVIPDKATDKVKALDRWQIGFSDSGRALLGLPVTAKPFLEFPDLLLCPTPSHQAKIARAERPF